MSDVSLPELAEQCKKLWSEYFASPKKAKPKLMDAYNRAAALYNEGVGFTCMTIIDDSTKDSIKTRPITPPEINTESEPESPKKKTGSIIEQIIALHKEGKTNKEIIALGFNKSTVGRQVSEYKKSLQ